MSQQNTLTEAGPPAPAVRRRPASATLPHLETFRLVCERGSFAKAALALGVTQAAVSQRVAALERAAGVRLFDRVKGRARINAAGRRALEAARAINALHGLLAHDLKAMAAPAGPPPAQEGGAP